MNPLNLIFTMKRFQIVWVEIMALLILGLRLASCLEVFESNSTTDDRSYRGLKLDNGMKVILVSDPNTEEAAASLFVPVGSLNDPPEFLGMAHFVEHLLFLENGKYPEKEALNAFLNQHGGSSNAGTYEDKTEYYYTVKSDVLEPSLDRFAHMLISPKFVEHDLETEVEAVDSEFNVKYADDDRRISRIKKLTANQSHPYSTFIVGNRETLWTQPRSKGLDVRKAVVEFYDKYYSSNIMTLAVLGCESLDELQKMVVDIFTQIPNKNVTVSSWPTKPYGPHQYQTIAQIVPVSDYRQVILAFECPDHAYELLVYFGELMEHKGSGSLSSFLKRRKFATNIIISVGEFYRGYNGFEVAISLTELGFLYLNSVIEHVFEYIKLLEDENPPGLKEDEAFWSERNNITRISNQFGTKNTPIDAVSYLSKCILTISIEKVIGDVYFRNETTKYDIDSAYDAFQALRADKLRLFVVSKTFENKTKLEDPVYKVQYNWEHIDPILIRAWSNVQRNPKLTLPQKNAFIPSKFDIKFPESNHTGIPRLINDTSLSQIWFLQDNEYLSPNAVIFAELYSPIADVTPVNAALNWLTSEMMPFVLSEKAYGASLVDQKYSFADTSGGKTITVKGYDDNLKVLLSEVMLTIANFTPDSYQFEITKADYKQKLQHLMNRQSCDVTNTESIVLERKWTTEDILAVIDDVTFPDLLRFFENFISRMKFHWLFYGNLLPEEALEMAEESQNHFIKLHETKPLLPAEIMRNREIELPKGSRWLYTKETPKQTNTCTKVIFQSGSEDPLSSLNVDLLNQIAAIPAYVKLRSEEQLGYVVITGTYIYYREVQSFQMYVQGDKNPTFVESRIDNFLRELSKKVGSMTEAEFLKHRQSIIDAKNTRPTKLETKSFEHWNEIVYENYNFRRKDQEAKALESITLSRFRKFLIEFLGIESETQRRLSIHVIPSKKRGAYRRGKCFECTNSTTEGFSAASQLHSISIKDIAAWKRKQRIYGN